MNNRSNVFVGKQRFQSPPSQPPPKLNLLRYILKHPEYFHPPPIKRINELSRNHKPPKRIVWNYHGFGFGENTWC